MITKLDCIDFIESLNDKSVQMVFADLPYGATNAEWDTPIDLQKFWESVVRKLAPTGVIVMTGTMPFTATLARSRPQFFKHEWIWEKTSGTGHLNVKTRPLSCHESVLVFSPFQYYKYNPQKTTGHARKVSSALHKKSDVTTEIYGNYKKTSYDSTDRYPRSVLKFKTDKQKLALHSTQKPLALLEYLTKTYTDEGDLVVDSTCGSGGIGVAAVNLKRRWAINDNSDVNVEIAKRRIEENWDANPPKDIKAILNSIKNDKTIHSNL